MLGLTRNQEDDLSKKKPATDVPGSPPATPTPPLALDQSTLSATLGSVSTCRGAVNTARSRTESSQSRFSSARVELNQAQSAEHSATVSLQFAIDKALTLLQALKAAYTN